VRGKVARALANQLCLAAKADAFSKRTISPQLKAKFDERFAQIMKEYEAEKAKKAQVQEQAQKAPAETKQGPVG
jgi:RNA processing factor Prp31